MAFETQSSFELTQSVALYPRSTQLLYAARMAARRARTLPVGADRNELRQIAICLKWMARNQSERCNTGSHHAVFRGDER